MEAFLIRHIIPKLCLVLRNEFIIDPSNQKLDALAWIFPWREYTGDALFGQMLETEFFTVWLRTLFLWLRAPGVDRTQVRGWYIGWKGVFSKYGCEGLVNVKEGFKKGLDLMNSSISGNLQGIQPDAGVRTVKREKAAVTFKDLVEQTASERGLYVVPLGISHRQTGKALFRIVSERKNGVVVYIDEGVLFAELDGGWMPMGIEEVMDRVQLK